MPRLANADAQIRALLAEQFEVDQLLIDLTLVDKFLLDVVVVPTPRGARWLLSVIENEVPKRREEALRVRVVAPDAAKARPISPVTTRELIDDVLRPLLLPVDRPATGFGITCLDASTARRMDAQSWAVLFSRLNEQRDAIIEALGEPLVIVIPPALEAVLAHSAPDVWSARSAVHHVRIADAEAHAVDVIDNPAGADRAPRSSRALHVLLAAQSDHAVHISDQWRASALNMASIHAQFVAAAPEARALAQRAVDNAQRAVDAQPDSLQARATLSEALQQLGNTIADHGTLSEQQDVARRRVRNAERWVELAPRAVEPRIACALAFRAAAQTRVASSREDAQRSILEARIALELSDTRMSRLALASVLSVASEVMLGGGATDDATALARESLELVAGLAADLDAPSAVAARLILAEISMSRAHFDAALQLVLEAVDIAEHHRSRAPGLADAHVEAVVAQHRLAATYRATGDDARARAAAAHARTLATSALARWRYHSRLSAWALDVYVLSLDLAGDAIPLEEQRSWLATATEIAEHALPSFAGDAGFETQRLRLEAHSARLPPAVVPALPAIR
jgi:hypothetical protein